MGDLETTIEGPMTLDGVLARELEERISDSSRLAFRVAYAVLRRHEDAEDVAQEAFLRACKSFHGLRDRARFRAWLARISWRLAIDKKRGDNRRQRRDQLVAEATPTAADAEKHALSLDVQDRLRRAIDGLPEKLRMVLVLCAIEGHEIREVAALLELPEGTVKSRLYLARKRLMEVLPWLVNAIR